MSLITTNYEWNGLTISPYAKITQRDIRDIMVDVEVTPAVYEDVTTDIVTPGAVISEEVVNEDGTVTPEVREPDVITQQTNTVLVSPAVFEKVKKFSCGYKVNVYTSSEKAGSVLETSYSFIGAESPTLAEAYTDLKSRTEFSTWQDA